MHLFAVQVQNQQCLFAPACCPIMQTVPLFCFSLWLEEEEVDEHGVTHLLQLSTATMWSNITVGLHSYEFHFTCV